MISILCAANKSNYYKIPNLDIWNKERNAYNFTSSQPVICHPPCAQWSRMRSFSKDCPVEKALAEFCYLQVIKNGGILEHPAGSSFSNLSQHKNINSALL